MSPTAKALLAVALPALLLVAPAAGGDSIEDFYKGRQIRFIVALDAGDDYDLWARAIGRHIGRHIPGHPTLVAENMPGGGQIVGTNYLYNVAAKDQPQSRLI
jgi:tripartite-type tricarboxylate transporter receptor subunit TctC